MIHTRCGAHGGSFQRVKARLHCTGGGYIFPRGEDSEVALPRSRGGPSGARLKGDQRLAPKGSVSPVSRQRAQPSHMSVLQEFKTEPCDVGGECLSRAIHITVRCEPDLHPDSLLGR